MNSGQFERTLVNDHQRKIESKLPRCLFGDRAVNVQLGEWAEACRLRAQVQAVWEKIAEPDWLREARVSRVRRQLIEIEVDSPVLLAEVRRQHSALQRLLLRRVPQARQVRMTLSGMEDR